MFGQREDGGEVEKDFLKRQVQQLVKALQRVLHLATIEQQQEQADEALQRATRASLKLELSFLSAVDARSCAVILGTGDRIRGYARILRTQAELLRLRGQEKESVDRLRRAWTLHEEAAKRLPPGEPLQEEDRQELALLQTLLPR
jgi:phytoene dehydrogenase-like protein